MPNKSIDETLKETANYLYKIDGDCSPELYQAIDRLRQLINEEFVGKKKSVSSQLIYDILIKAVQKEVKKARVEGGLEQLKWIRNICSDLDDDYGELDAFEAIEVHTNKETKELLDRLEEIG